MSNNHQGIIYKSTGSWYLLKNEESCFLKARIKGKLKIDRAISSTNPLAVGDLVHYEQAVTGEEDVQICTIAPRNNYIVRTSPHNRHQKHIIAANLDLAIIMVTLNSPATSQGFIDRFLVTAEAYHIPVLILFNKMDLFDSATQETFHLWKKMYENAGYQTQCISAFNQVGLTALKETLEGNTTLFCGHSGVGKSTLINILVPEAHLKTNNVSDSSGKGQHTTTFAEMFDLNDHTKIIDTPGIKEFGIIDFEKAELAQYFPEMKKLMHLCKFNDCTHIDEPFCAIKKALTEQTLIANRYISYLSLFEGIERKY